jgi:hypothetical protein
MPAPTPIQIRYGPTGLLAEAAAQVGQNAGLLDAQGALEQRRRLEAELWSQELARRQQDRQFSATMAMQANQLQEAHRMNVARGSTPTSEQSFSASSPLAQSIQNLKGTYLRMATDQGVEGETRTMLEAAAADPGVDTNAFKTLASDAERTAFRVREQGQKTAEAKSSKQAKKAYLDSLASSLPPQYVTAFQAMVDDDSVSSPQLRTAVAGAMSQLQSEARVESGRLISGIDNNIRDVERDIDARLKVGVNPEATPASYNPTLLESGGFFSNLGDAYVPGFHSNLVEGGKQGDLTARIEFARLQNKLDALKKQREQLARGGETPSSGTVAPDVTAPVRVSTPAEAAQLAAGTRFITPDGQVRVR